MAENDGNTIPAAQPLRRPHTTSELLPVRPSVFEFIHHANIRFEKLIHDFQLLQTVPYFPHEKLSNWQNILCRVRAEANASLVGMIQQRENKNAHYHDRLCVLRERELADPDDVLIEAEQRKQQFAQDQETDGRAQENE